jgi:CHC2 zinc finger
MLTARTQKSQRDVSKAPADNTNICNSYPRYPFYQGNGFLGRHTLSVESLKDRISPKIFYERELHPMPTSKKSGWNSGGLCPFHTDKNPGSFFVHSHTGGYKCFSCGAKGGDILAFVMQRHSLSFKDALKKLAQDWEVFL